MSGATGTASLGDVALHYRQMWGAPVVPVNDHKQPLCEWGQWRYGGQTESAVKDLFSRPAHGLGLLLWPASALAVMDFDGPHAEHAWRSTGVSAPRTARVYTPHGAHDYYRMPPGVECDEVDRKVRIVTARECGCDKPCGVDLLVKGYALAPPTPGYREDPDYGLEPSRITDLPDGVLALMRHATATNNGERSTIAERIPEGERNATLYRLARSLKLRELTEIEMLATLMTVNRERCEPPLDDAEVRRIAAHAYEQTDRPEFAATGAGDRQESVPTTEPPWPALAPEALYGLAGEIVAAIDPHTEADKVAVLAQFICGFGNLIGDKPHFRVTCTRHPVRLFEALVGETAKARKGTSWSPVKHVLALADEAWAKTRVSGGLSSGEGLIDAVRDPRYEKQAIREKGRVVDYQEVLVDEGVADKRLLLIEEELASVLKVMAREGNILSPVLRQAWDSGDLHPLTKGNKIVATGAHVSIIGHVTKDELLRLLNETEQGNGFANRFIWVVVKRSKCLPSPEPIPDDQLKALAEKLKRAVAFAATVSEVARDAEADKVWAATYPVLSEGRPGLTGAILARAEAQVMRLALCYALLDSSHVIRLAHLNAALALWDYAEASARYIFGDATGDAVADRILSALRSQGPISETDIYSTLFHRNTKATRIHQALAMLQRVRLISASIVEETGGRKKTMWEATHSTCLTHKGGLNA